MPADRVPPGLGEPDSCAVSDALDRLGLPGAVRGLLPLTVARRIAGRVITVELGAPPGGERGGGVGERGGGGNSGDRDRDGSGRPPRRHLGAAAIDAAGPGDVIVVAARGRADAAGWGGVLSVGAAARGVSGVIVDGACRDVDEIAELGLPVYARSATPRTARGRLAEVGWGAPVRVADVTVSPGDYVVADSSGVVVIPGGLADRVMALAQRITAAEAGMLRRIRAGEPVSEVLSAAYEDMLKPGS